MATVPAHSLTTEKLDTLQTIQVADGVEIQLPPAGPIPRAFAYCLDGLFLSIVLAILALAFFLLGMGIKLEGVGDLFSGIGLLTYFVLEWGYHAMFECSRWGASPGKRIFGLRVVRTTGVSLTLREALVRNIIRTADSAPAPFGLVGLVSILFTKRFQRLGDLAADALVIYNFRPKELRQLGLMGTYDPGAQALGLAQQSIEAVPPPVALKRAEQTAIASFVNRLSSWTPPRQAEIADHLQPLTKRRGFEAVGYLRGLARWIRES